MRGSGEDGEPGSWGAILPPPTKLRALHPWASLSSSSKKQNLQSGTPLAVQGQRLQTPSAGGLGLVLGQGARAHLPQLRTCVVQLEDSSVSELRPSVAQ